MGIGYQPQEIPPFQPAKYTPRGYTWVINVMGYAGYIFSVVLIIFGTTILLFEDLRYRYLGDALASFISAVILFVLAHYLITNFGVKVFYISENGFVFDSPVKSPVAIPKDQIIHIAVKRPNPALSLLPITAPSIMIATYDQIYQFRVSRWREQKQILQLFDELSETVHDDFAEYYHRSKTTLYSFFIRLSQDTAGVVGLTIITIYLFLATWGGLAMMIDNITTGKPFVLFLRNPEFLNGDLQGYDYNTSRFHPPNIDFWFGTDWIGRDIFARLIFGTTFTFLIALTGGIISIFIVITLGISSAFYGRMWDTFVTRVGDALLTFPPFIPLILISTIATPIRIGIPGGYFLAIFVGMSFITWPQGARILRADVLEIIGNEYVLASKQIGASNWYILTKHVFPKLIPTIMVIFTYTFADIILGTTLLGFIGLDSESTLTWGSDLAKAVKYGEDLRLRWWTVFFPTLWIFILVFGLHLFSDSIRDILDPKLRGGEKAVPYEMQKDLEGLF